MISKKIAVIFTLSVSLSTQTAFASGSEQPIYIQDAHNLIIANKNLQGDVDKCLATHGIMECSVAEKLINFLDSCKEFSGGLDQIYDRTIWKSEEEKQAIKKSVLDTATEHGKVSGIMMGIRIISKISSS